MSESLSMKCTWEKWSIKRRGFSVKVISHSTSLETSQSKQLQTPTKKLIHINFSHSSKNLKEDFSLLNNFSTFKKPQRIMMNFRACLVLSLAVLVLAVCVSADRAHVERVKGAPNPRGRVESGSKGGVNLGGFSKFIGTIKTPGARITCEECLAGCPGYCAANPSLCGTENPTQAQCLAGCTSFGFC